jgi:cytochrome c553
MVRVQFRPKQQARNDGSSARITMRPLYSLRKILLLGVLAMNGAHAQDQSGGAAAQPMDSKNLFRNVCGFCHEDYGRKQGKGPQLMHNPNTDEFLFNRIKKGIPQKGMASFSWLTDAQIKEVVAFIRRLEPGVEPK